MYILRYSSLKLGAGEKNLDITLFQYLQLFFTPACDSRELSHTIFLAYLLYIESKIPISLDIV